MAAEVTDEVWNDFHTVVNMTSRELEDWLRTESAGQLTEAVPDQAGTDAGRRVLEILGKRRADLTEDDVRIMHKVIGLVRAERDPELDPKSGDAQWRRRMMNLGHDPLKPSS
jgi:hypothetical protein